MGDEVASAYAEELTDRMARERSERHRKYERLRYLAIEAKKNWANADGGDSWEQREYQNGVEAIIGGDPEYLLVLLQAWANLIRPAGEK